MAYFFKNTLRYISDAMEDQTQGSIFSKCIIFVVIDKLRY